MSLTIPFLVKIFCTKKLFWLLILTDIIFFNKVLISVMTQS